MVHRNFFLEQDISLKVRSEGKTGKGEEEEEEEEDTVSLRNINIEEMSSIRGQIEFLYSH